MVAFKGVSFCGASKARMFNLLFLQLSKCFSLEDLAIHLFKKGSVKTIQFSIVDSNEKASFFLFVNDVKFVEMISCSKAGTN